MPPSPTPPVKLLLAPVLRQSQSGQMECREEAVSVLSWGLIVGGGLYLWHQTRNLRVAEYGRYAPAAGRYCSARLGWFLQEVPSFLLPLLLLLLREDPGGERGGGRGRTLLLCTFTLHYFYR